MPDLKKQTPRQRAQMSYMMDVMRRLEWDLHNSIEMTGRIPEEWHEIAQKRPVSGKEKVTLRLEADVLKFFRSMGPDYGPRINDVLRSYMHARLAGVIRGAETTDHYRNREGAHDGPKPGFGDWDREVEAIRAKYPEMDSARAKMQEVMQRRYAEEGAPEPEALRPWVR
ncbi:MAG: BrnA antitoxin family protein [Tabrizicola sp.]|nr:BrnA antitoxin family protein [Tabrizicola sp.]